MVFVKAGRRLLSSFVAVAASIGAVTTPSAGFAASPNGYPVTNVNLRAGPGTDYPVVGTRIVERIWGATRTGLGRRRLVKRVPY